VKLDNLSYVLFRILIAKFPGVIMLAKEMMVVVLS
jgi:hypothetical protein